MHIAALPPAMVNVSALFPVKWMGQGFRSVFLPDTLAAQEVAGTWEPGRTALVLGGVVRDRPGPVPADVPVVASVKRWQWDLGFTVVAGAVIGSWPSTTARVPAPRSSHRCSSPPPSPGTSSTAAADDLPHRHPYRRLDFVAGLAVLHLAAVWIDHTASFALFAWGTMIFSSVPRRPAVAIVATLNLLPVPMTYLRDGTLSLVHGLLPLTVLGLAFALLLGTFVSHLVEQNEERAAMIAELSASRAEVARLSHEAGVATERARLAAEIHDTLAQGFTSIITLAQAAESATDPAVVSRPPALGRRHRPRQPRRGPRPGRRAQPRRPAHLRPRRRRAPAARPASRRRPACAPPATSTAPRRSADRAAGRAAALAAGGAHQRPPARPRHVCGRAARDDRRHGRADGHRRRRRLHRPPTPLRAGSHRPGFGCLGFVCFFFGFWLFRLFRFLRLRLFCRLVGCGCRSPVRRPRPGSASPACAPGSSRPAACAPSRAAPAPAPPSRSSCHDHASCWSTTTPSSATACAACWRPSPTSTVVGEAGSGDEAVARRATPTAPTSC